MLGSTECVNQAIILVMLLYNIVASLTLLYLTGLFNCCIFILLCFFCYFNHVLTYFNKFSLFIVICTYLSIIDNPSSISLLFEPILVY